MAKTVTPARTKWKRFGERLSAFWRGFAKILCKYRYFGQKLLLALLTLWLTTLFTFLLISSLPGDIVYNYAVTLQSNYGLGFNEAYALAVKMLNYDPNENVFVSYFRYLGGLFQGNLGQSIYIDSVNVNSILKEYLPWTLLVSAVSLFLSFGLGTSIGIRMARKRNGLTDTFYTGLITVTSSLPDYLLGIILLMYFGSELGWFPTYGAYDLSTSGSFFPWLYSVLRHAFLPILTYTISQTGGWALLAKGSAVSVLGDDYVGAAIARGLPERLIERKYLRKNAMLPLVTSLVISFAYLFGGSAVMESVFAYPGIGRAFANYIGKRDYFVVQGLFVFLSFMVIMSNLVADFVCGLLDPRVRED